MDLKLRENEIRSEIASLLQTATELRDKLKESKDMQLNLGVAGADLETYRQAEREIESQFQYVLDQVGQRQEDLILLRQRGVAEEVFDGGATKELESLKEENRVLREEVVGWQAKAAEQFKELSDRSEDLRLMITEREALQKNCDSLKVSVEDLLAQIRRREIEHEESLDAMQMQFASAKGAMVSKEQPKEVGVKKVQPDLTLLEESKHDRSRVVVQRKEEVERLDTNVLGVDISDIPTADKLFESTVVSGSNKKLRRFKGHRNTEDVKEVYRDSDGVNERAKSLQERAEAYRSSLGDTESVDDIAFLIAKEELLAEQRRKRT